MLQVYRMFIDVSLCHHFVLFFWWSNVTANRIGSGVLLGSFSSLSAIGNAYSEVAESLESRAAQERPGQPEAKPPPPEHGWLQVFERPPIARD